MNEPNILFEIIYLVINLRQTRYPDPSILNCEDVFFFFFFIKSLVYTP